MSKNQSQSQSQRESPANLSKKLVARRYGICTRSVNNWVKAGAIPAPTEWTSQTKLWPLDVLDEHDKRKRLQLAAAGGAA